METLLGKVEIFASDFDAVVGDNIDLKEFYLMVNNRDHILRVPSYVQLISLKSTIYERADFGESFHLAIQKPSSASCNLLLLTQEMVIY